MKEPTFLERIFVQKLNFDEPFTNLFCKKHFIFGCNARSLDTMEVLPARENKQGWCFHTMRPRDSGENDERAVAQRQVI